MSGFTVYAKDTGQATWFQYSVDARECVATGRFSWEPPENAVSNEAVDLSSEDAERLSGIAEKARLGSPLKPEERDELGEFQIASGQFSPAGSGEVPAPGVDPVFETFNPATSDRKQLFDYLREHGEDPANALSTEKLRDQADAIFMARKGK